jgi:hypothetical protein
VNKILQGIVAALCRLDKMAEREVEERGIIKKLLASIARISARLKSQQKILEGK